MVAAMSTGFSRECCKEAVREVVKLFWFDGDTFYDACDIPVRLYDEYPELFKGWEDIPVGLMKHIEWVKDLERDE
jgi:hypothetical protein